MIVPATHSALIRGRLVHSRDDARARRTFAYPVYMASLDLDELPALDRRLRLFAHNHAGAFALHDADYDRGLGAPDLSAAFTALLAGNDIAAPATTRLVTNLRVLGYVFNPVSFFLGYDARGALACAVAEVNNTYGGRRRYVLGPRERAPADDPRTTRFVHARELFVSPFLPGELTYTFDFAAPLDGDRVAIAMHVTDRTGARVFYARLAGDRAPLTDRALLAAAARYPLMTAQVIGLIHWQALKLRLAGVPYRRPAADHRPARDP